MRKSNELNEAVVYLRRLLSVGESQLVHDEEFRRAFQTLEDAAEVGMVPRGKLMRAVSVIAKQLCSHCLKNDGTR
jgi:Ca2+-binding EF-hand superfamily protein